MATMKLTLTHVCAGGEHAEIAVEVNGQSRGTYAVRVSDVTGTFADDEIETFLAGVIRLHKVGKTLAQVRNDLQAGLTVTL